MSNERIYFATQQVALKPVTGNIEYDKVKGAQTVSVSETFPSQEIFQLGRLEVYEQLEDLPDVEITLTKVLDGCPLAYCLATQTATGPGLIQRTNEQCMMALSIFEIEKDGAEGTPLCTAEMSGNDLSNVSYTFGTDGAFEESISLVGNDILVSNDSTIVNPADLARAQSIDVEGLFTGSDDQDPCTFVNQRQHFLWAYNGGAGLDVAGRIADPDASILPTDLPAITDSGTNEIQPDGSHACSVQSISVSTSLSREELNELGTLKPTARYLQPPIEVTCEIEVRAYECPFKSATANGILSSGNEQCSNASNLIDQSIRIAVCDGTRIYLGRKCRMQSLNFGGGDASGGNATVSYSYRTFNDFTVMHEEDPNPLAAGWWTNRADYLTG
jgi:hypothetical protein